MVVSHSHSRETDSRTCRTIQAERGGEFSVSGCNEHLRQVEPGGRTMLQWAARGIHFALHYCNACELSDAR
jgi:hypothetical protein